jgi:hypothetical protein
VSMVWAGPSPQLNNSTTAATPAPSPTPTPGARTHVKVVQAHIAVLAAGDEATPVGRKRDAVDRPEVAAHVAELLSKDFVVEACFEAAGLGRGGGNLRGRTGEWPGEGRARGVRKGEAGGSCGGRLHRDPQQKAAGGCSGSCASGSSGSLRLQAQEQQQPPCSAAALCMPRGMRRSPLRARAAPGLRPARRRAQHGP